MDGERKKRVQFWEVEGGLETESLHFALCILKSEFEVMTVAKRCCPFQCRRYKYDDEVRLKADMVYNRFKVCHNTLIVKIVI